MPSGRDREGQDRSLAQGSAIGALRKGCEEYLDGMWARVACADENGILILRQISGAAVDHACVDLRSSRRVYLDHSPVLIALAIGTNHLDAERARHGRLRCVDVVVVSGRFGVDDVNLPVAIEIGHRHTPTPARGATQFGCGNLDESTTGIVKDRAASAISTGQDVF